MMLGSSSLTKSERAAVMRAVAAMELCFGWNEARLGRGSADQRSFELKRKAVALIRHDRALNGQPYRSMRA